MGVKLTKIVLPKKEDNGYDQPLMFFNKLTLIGGACCVFMKLIERPIWLLPSKISLIQDTERKAHLTTMSASVGTAT